MKIVNGYLKVFFVFQVVLESFELMCKYRFEGLEGINWLSVVLVYWGLNQSTWVCGILCQGFIGVLNP